MCEVEGYFRPGVTAIPSGGITRTVAPWASLSTYPYIQQNPDLQYAGHGSSSTFHRESPARSTFFPAFVQVVPPQRRSQDYPVPCLASLDLLFQAKPLAVTSGALIATAHPSGLPSEVLEPCVTRLNGKDDV